MALAIAGAVALAVWIYLLLGRGRFWLERPAGPLPQTFAPAPSVCAVIPARNEQDVIGLAVSSLMEQNYSGDLRAIVVDDQSHDATAALAAGAGQKERLAIVSGAPLPQGWTGKLWAISQGVATVTAHPPDYFLLTDADIVHAPDALSGLVARARSADYDLVSHMATLSCATFAERALVPAFVFFFFMLYPPRWIRDPNRRTAGAAGGCILIRRTALERIGGIASIRQALIDDCALAAAVKRSGGRLWLGLDSHTRSIRKYGGFRDLGAMISRTAFTQLNHSPLLLAATLMGMVLTYFVPPALALAASGIPQKLGIAGWAAMAVAWSPMLRFYRRSLLWAPLLPLVAAFYAGATFHSAFSYWSGSGGMWKGRAQDLA
jgi:hopene-associated glycosyltransferase HpnB